MKPDHLVQVGLSVAAQRHSVQICLRVLDTPADDARLGDGASRVRGHQLHLDLPHLVMRPLLTLAVPPPPLISWLQMEGGGRRGAGRSAGRWRGGWSVCRWESVLMFLILKASTGKCNVIFPKGSIKYSFIHS